METLGISALIAFLGYRISKTSSPATELFEAPDPKDIPADQDDRKFLTQQMSVQEAQDAQNKLLDRRFTDAKNPYATGIFAYPWSLAPTPAGDRTSDMDTSLLSTDKLRMRPRKQEQAARFDPSIARQLITGSGGASTSYLREEERYEPSRFLQGVRPFEPIRVAPLDTNLLRVPERESNRTANPTNYIPGAQYMGSAPRTTSAPVPVRPRLVEGFSNDLTLNKTAGVYAKSINPGDRVESIGGFRETTNTQARMNPVAYFGAGGSEKAWAENPDLAITQIVPRNEVNSISEVSKSDNFGFFGGGWGTQQAMQPVVDTRPERRVVSRAGDVDYLTRNAVLPKQYERNDNYTMRAKRNTGERALARIADAPPGDGSTAGYLAALETVTKEGIDPRLRRPEDKLGQTTVRGSAAMTGTRSTVYETPRGAAVPNNYYRPEASRQFDVTAESNMRLASYAATASTQKGTPVTPGSVTQGSFGIVYNDRPIPTIEVRKNAVIATDLPPIDAQGQFATVNNYDAVP